VPKRDEVTREWRNYIMRSLMICIAGDKIKKNEMGEECIVYGKKRGWWGETEGMRPLERHRHRWKDNIMMEF
jgi:hypothetical protein